MTLVERIRRVLSHPLPGGDEYLVGDDVASGDGGALVPAAVLIAIVDRPSPGLLLTKRNDALRRHAGQVAFPGGRIDPGDDGPIAAALREAWEEVSLPPEQVEIIGTLERYRTISGYAVTPVVGVIPPGLALVAQTDEVASLFEAPLDVMLEPSNHIEQAVEWQGRDRHYYEISWDGERVWGATAAMIVNLARRLAYEG